MTSGETQYVFVVENDMAKYVEITTGLTGNGVTEVSSGLTGGEQLVTVGQAYLKDGAAVRIVSGESQDPAPQAEVPADQETADADSAAGED